MKTATDLLLDHWAELQGYIKERWPEIPDVELELINGQRQRLIGALQEHYWITRKQAIDQIDEFEEEFASRLSKAGAYSRRTVGR